MDVLHNSVRHAYFYTDVGGGNIIIKIMVNNILLILSFKIGIVICDSFVKNVNVDIQIQYIYLYSYMKYTF